jgi:hypothetical protein
MARMTPAQRVELTVAIDPASDPITGSVGDPRGGNVEFAGWLGFAAALEELLKPRAGPSGAPAPAPPPGRPRP